MNKVEKERRNRPHITRAFDRRHNGAATKPAKDDPLSHKEEIKFFQERVRLAGRRQQQ